MRLVSLKATPMVPWFDDQLMFNEVGIFNMGEQGMFVVANYFGDKEWVNEIDPQAIIDAHAPKVMTLSVPDMAMAGEAFTVSGAYATDGKYILMVGQTPVSITVTGGKFSRQVTIGSPGVFDVYCRDVQSEHATLMVAL